MLDGSNKYSAPFTTGSTDGLRLTVIHKLDRQMWDDNTAKEAGQGFTRPEREVRVLPFSKQNLAFVIWCALNVLVVSASFLLPLFRFQTFEGYCLPFPNS